MLKLQDVKSGLSDAALGEGTGGSLHKMSVKDIKQVRDFSIVPWWSSDGICAALWNGSDARG
jgi:hypothetical protein